MKRPVELIVTDQFPRAVVIKTLGTTASNERTGTIQNRDHDAHVHVLTLFSWQL